MVSLEVADVFVIAAVVVVIKFVFTVNAFLTFYHEYFNYCIFSCPISFRPFIMTESDIKSDNQTICSSVQSSCNKLTSSNLLKKGQLLHFLPCWLQFYL